MVLEHAFVRFLVTGGLNTLLGLGVIFFLQLFLAPHHANLAAFILLVPVTFMSHRNWSFKDGGDIARAFLRYLPVVVAGYLVNAWALDQALIFGVEPHLAQVLAIACYVLASYLLLRCFVFCSPVSGSARRAE